MQYKTIGEINHYASENVNPARFPEQYFELYSVPHFSEGYPEIIKGKDVGATKQVVQEGDVLICKINPRINRVWKVTRHTDYPLIASSEWVIVRNADLNADYLTYYFSSPKFRVLINSELTGMGGSLTRAQPKQIRRYSVPVPDKEEQHFVVRNLALLDHLISLRQRQAEKLDELVKARFVEMFGDPVRNTKHWEKSSLLALGSCKNGMSFHANESGIKLRCLGVGDFKNLSYIDDVEQLPFVSLAEKPSANCFLHDGDIVFVRSNGNKALVGRCLLVYPRDTPTIYSGFCIRYRLVTEKVDPIYALHVLKADGIRQKMSGRGANIQNLNQKILAAIEMPIPPLPLQNAFATFVYEVDREKERIQRSAALLETLKRSLMQQYFG